jgi:hypothetical protein
VHKRTDAGVAEASPLLREASIVRLKIIDLALGALGVSVLSSRGWRGARNADLGWMSEQWLTELRAGSR